MVGIVGQLQWLTLLWVQAKWLMFVERFSSQMILVVMSSYETDYNADFGV